MAVFGIALLVVLDLDLAIYREIDQLTDRHALIDLYGLLYGNFQGPVAAETDVSLAGRGVDVDAEPAGARLALQEGHMGMGFGVFKRYTEVEDMRVEDKSLVRYFESLDGVMLPGVEDMLLIGGQGATQVYIIAVATQAVTLKRFDQDVTIFYLLKYPGI